MPLLLRGPQELAGPEIQGEPTRHDMWLTLRLEGRSYADGMKYARRPADAEAIGELWCAIGGHGDSCPGVHNAALAAREARFGKNDYGYCA